MYKNYRLLIGAGVVTVLFLSAIYSFTYWQGSPSLRTAKNSKQNTYKECVKLPKTHSSSDRLNPNPLKECDSRVDWRNVDFNQFSNHLGPVWSVAISPDGKTFASGGGGINSIWDLRTGNLLYILSGHSGWIYTVAFSPNGQTLASSSSDHTIKLWNLRTKEPLHTLSSHVGSVWSVAFSPDGQTLASSSSDRTIKLWNLRNGKLLRTLPGHSDWVFSVAFSPDGQILASASRDRTIKLWNLPTGQLLRTLSGHANAVC